MHCWNGNPGFASVAAYEKAAVWSVNPMHTGKDCFLIGSIHDQAVNDEIVVSIHFSQPLPTGTRIPGLKNPIVGVAKI
jgi:hypothetical protein